MSHSTTPSSYTPGPWDVWVSPANVPYIDDGKLWIASMNTSNRSSSEIAANTVLISAAPDLLDAAFLALDEIEQWNEIMDGSEDPRTAEAIAALEAAIDKATGKEILTPKE